MIEPEKRMSIDNVARHPWMSKYSVTPLTKSIVDQILSIQKPDVEPLINESTVEAIVRTVNVPRETVIECVRQNKCDDLCAIYKMVEVNKRDLERERLQAVINMVPPLSPTSMTPFFTNEQPKVCKSQTLSNIFLRVLFHFPFRSKKFNVVLDFSGRCHRGLQSRGRRSCGGSKRRRRSKLGCA